MKKAIIGKKLGMTQVFTADGKVIPVTVVEAGPCTVLAKKTTEKDGYNAIVVAYGNVKEKNMTKPELGVYKKANIEPKKMIKELKIDGEYEIGAEIKADVFTEKEKVDVSGLTRGRGFSGVIRRWNQRRLRMSHGTGPVHREVGSLGASSGVARVLKGRHMPGHYGHERVTIQNLEIVKADAERNLLLVKGCVPGPRGSVLEIKTAVKGGNN